MQTFLPYPSYEESAYVLDHTRLGNQAYRECVTLIRGKWPNHPASKMWRGYEYSLAEYALALLSELRIRGRPYPKWEDYFKARRDFFALLDPKGTIPHWLGDPLLHSTHRANLLRKDFAHYSQFGWTETPSSEYYWPEGRIPSFLTPSLNF